MKKINFIKLFLDLIMGIIFALLFNTRILGGLTFHEIAGLSIGFAILVHTGLNWRWVKNVTLSILNKNIPLKTRIGYVLNILLLLDIAVVIISGIFISKVVFTGLNVQSSFFNEATHTSASFMALALIGIHVGLHWQWIMNVFKKLVNFNKTSKALNYTSKVVAGLVLVFGLYNMSTVNYFSKTVQMFNITSSDIKQENRGIKGEEKFQNDNISENALNNTNQYNKESYNKGKGQGNFPSRNGREMENSSILTILSKYLSIMSVFTVITFLIEKLFSRKKASIN